MNGPTDLLLIEDSPSQALRFRLLLEQAGYRVVLSADGAEGWRRACAERPRAVLLDVDLPGLDGFQLLGRLKRDRRTAAIPVVMLTGRDNVTSVQRAIDLGVDGYVFKDDAPHQLCDTIAQVLANTPTSNA